MAEGTVELTIKGVSSKEAELSLPGMEPIPVDLILVREWVEDNWGRGNEITPTATLTQEVDTDLLYDFLTGPGVDVNDFVMDKPSSRIASSSDLAQYFKSLNAVKPAPEAPSRPAEPVAELEPEEVESLVDALLEIDDLPMGDLVVKDDGDLGLSIDGRFSGDHTFINQMGCKALEDWLDQKLGEQSMDQVDFGPQLPGKTTDMGSPRGELQMGVGAPGFDPEERRTYYIQWQEDGATALVGDVGYEVHASDPGDVTNLEHFEGTIDELLQHVYNLHQDGIIAFSSEWPSAAAFDYLFTQANRLGLDAERFVEGVEEQSIDQMDTGEPFEPSGDYQRVVFRGLTLDDPDEQGVIDHLAGIGYPGVKFIGTINTTAGQGGDGRRTDQVFDLPSEHTPRFAMWRLTYPGLSWWDDYVTNDRSIIPSSDIAKFDPGDVDASEFPDDSDEEDDDWGELPSDDESVEAAVQSLLSEGIGDADRIDFGEHSDILARRVARLELLQQLGAPAEIIRREEELVDLIQRSGPSAEPAPAEPVPAADEPDVSDPPLAPEAMAEQEIDRVDFGPDGLPELAYVWAESESTVGIVKHGASGYFTIDPGWLESVVKAFGKPIGQELVDVLNDRLGITKKQAEKMEIGSMFGWHVPAAQPDYDDVEIEPAGPEEESFLAVEQDETWVAFSRDGSYTSIPTTKEKALETRQELEDTGIPARVAKESDAQQALTRWQEEGVAV